MSPKLSYAHALIRQDSHALYLANKWGECLLELKETLEGKELLGDILVGQELPGGLRSFLVTNTSLGVTKGLFGLYRLPNAL